MRLALAPVPYAWPRRDLRRFYEDALAWPVDIVVLGETVCTKRDELGPDDWWAIARDLADAGREVVLTTPVLPEPHGGRRALERLVLNERFLVEANDLTTVALLEAHGRPFVGGPGLNLYNHRDVALFQESGMTRWVLNAEQGRATLVTYRRASAGGPSPEIEVEAWGRPALAYSHRCFSARAAGAPRDDCRMACRERPDGSLVATREGVPFLRLNGRQVLGEKVFDLAPEIPTLARLGVGVLRLQPSRAGTGETVARFRSALEGARLARVGAASPYWSPPPDEVPAPRNSPSP